MFPAVILKVLFSLHDASLNSDSERHNRWLQSEPTSRPAMIPTNLEQSRNLANRITELGEWFHNIDLMGTPTAPEHFLEIFRASSGRVLLLHCPKTCQAPQCWTSAATRDFTQWNLNVGAQAGCLAWTLMIAIWRRPASLLLFWDLEIEFEKRSVYDVDQIAGQFDYRAFHGRVLSLALSSAGSG